MVQTQLLRTARRRAGLSLRALAARAGTSHSTLAAYEAGRVAPTIDTFERVLAACGYSLSATLTPRVAPDGERARELTDALELAAQFPARHHATIEYPPFPHRAA
jgi:transcriptional regulator with XRE-family HTH domain